MFVPQNDDHRVVHNGQDHNLQPDIIKLLCWINQPFFPAEEMRMQKLL